MTKLKCYIVFCIILAVTHGNPSTNLLSTTSSTMNSSTANPTLPPSTNSSTQPTPTTPPEPTPKPTTKPTIKPTTKPTPQPTPNPTSPPPPVPVPDPTMGTWSLEYENSNRSCIVVDMAVQFEILSVNQTTKINLPINATSSGSCGANEDNVSLRWAENRNRLEFDFVELNNSRFQLDKISVKFVNLTIPRIGNKTYVLVHNKAEFSTPLANSYKCAKIQTLNLTEVDSNETVAYLHLSHVQFQAFSNISGHTFNSAVDCDGSLTTDVVPIVVGCVLAALVVMVLIAYLIGRRRCQARGYLSM